MLFRLSNSGAIVATFTSLLSMLLYGVKTWTLPRLCGRFSLYSKELYEPMTWSLYNILVSISTGSQPGRHPKKCPIKANYFLFLNKIVKFLSSIPSNDFFRSCGYEKEEETVLHFMCQCTALAGMKRIFLAFSCLESLTDFCNIKVAALAKFILVSGWFPLGNVPGQIISVVSHSV